MSGFVLFAGGIHNERGNVSGQSMLAVRGVDSVGVSAQGGGPRSPPPLAPCPRGAKQV